MRKLLVLYPHPVSREDFKRHYVDTHLPLVAQLPGLKSSRHSFEIEGVGAPSPYFCVWEGEFDNAEAMSRAMQSPEGQRVSSDVANYATGGALVLHYDTIDA